MFRNLIFISPINILHFSLRLYSLLRKEIHQPFIMYFIQKFDISEFTTFKVFNI